MGQHINANPTSNPAINIRDFFPVPLQTGKIREMFCEDLTPEAKAARDGGIEYVLDYTTDRYSAGDRVREGADAKGKGALIALISKKLFSRIKNCVPTAILDEDEINSVFNPDNEFDLVIPPNCTVMRRLKMFKIEAVVRGWFTGSIKGPYKAGKRQFSDAIFPDGLHEMDKLPKNAYTPTNKAPQGEHDELVTFADIVSLLKAEGMGDEAEARIIEGYSLRVFRTLSKILREEYGIVLIDMKLEFGIDELGNIYLADEISPDSCRFVFLEDFIPGQPLKTSDKQILRNWVKAHPDEPVPEEIIKNLLRGYVRIAKALGIDVSEIDMVDLAE